MRTQVVALLALLAGTLHAQEIRYTFANLPWGSSVAATQTGLRAGGYTLLGTTKDGDLQFQGKILGHDMIGVAFMSPTAGLTKIALAFPTDHDYKDVYQTVVSALTEKFGKGDELRAFDQPYDDGDGYEETAIIVGKAHILTRWRGVDDRTGMGVMIDKTNTQIFISVAYESTLWTVESARRKARAF